MELTEFNLDEWFYPGAENIERRILQEIKKGRRVFEGYISDNCGDDLLEGFINGGLKKILPKTVTLIKDTNGY
jgi:hypothetical protein